MSKSIQIYKKNLRNLKKYFENKNDEVIERM